jgi:hypothetical protein
MGGEETAAFSRRLPGCHSVERPRYGLFGRNQSTQYDGVLRKIRFKFVMLPRRERRKLEKSAKFPGLRMVVRQALGAKHEISDSRRNLGWGTAFRIRNGR